MLDARHNPSFRQSGRRPGFTLIELLVVMGIIATLTALVVAVGTHLWTKALVMRTQGTVALLALGLDDFKRTYGAYPNQDGSYGSVPGLGYTGNNVDIRALYFRLRDSQCLKEPVESRYLTRLADNDYVVNDGWGNPIAYRFPRQANDGHFDLWSMGPDGQDARANPGDTIDPADMTDARNQDNIVWGQFERR
jgi:prepilin-type N-terminal cleavage/methylation domain-containing protein